MFSAATAFDTPAGACALAWSDAGLTRVRPFEASPASAAARFAKQGAILVEESQAPPHIAAVIAALRAFLSGAPTAFGDVALDFSGLSEFEAALYRALRAVGWGETVSYGDLARHIGEGNGAARAVGVAMGRNPWPLIVPCHRVLTSEGKLGGFSAPGGGRTKSALLAREGVHLDGGQLALFD
jgi:methylated-DNA-[protein]-cysteine S-methyltransferase